MNLKFNIRKNTIFFLLLTFAVSSCNKDFNTVGYNLIGSNAFETSQVELPVVSHQNRAISDFQADGLNTLQLGTIDIPNIGESSAYIISQLNLPPTTFFGGLTKEQEQGSEDNTSWIQENEQVISAYLEIPFFYNSRDRDGDGVYDSLDIDPDNPESDTDGDSISDAVETQDGTNPLSDDSDGDGILDAEDTDNSDYIIENKTYSIDSIFGNKNSTFNLKVEELTYYLNALDPSDNFESNQAFYSSRDLYQEDFVGETLFDESYQLDLGEVRINYIEDDPDTEDVDETTLIQNRRSPRIKVPLNTDFFQRKFIDIEGSDSLANTSEFQKYMKGIYIRMENPSEDLYMLLNFNSASIVVTYEYDRYNDNDTPDDTNDFSIDRSRRDFALTPAITINHLNNSYINPAVDEAVGQTSGTNNLYLKGGMGLTSNIELFGNHSDGSAASKLDEIRENSWLINEANLVFYVDSDWVESLNTEDIIADRLYLYKEGDGTPLLDYIDDQTVDNTQHNKSKYIYGGILEYEDGRPYRYKFKITQHVNNLIRKDSTNVPLRLAVSADISNQIVKRAFFNVEGEEISYPTATILNPLGTVLIGSNPEEEFENQRLKLELIYTNFKN